MLFIAIFYGITIIWERDLGVINKFLVSPTPRLALVFGKSLSAGARALPQALIIYILSAILGVKLNFNPLALLSVIIIVVLGAACFSTSSMIIACILKTRDRVMGIGQILTMPMFFASNAIYPHHHHAWLATGDCPYQSADLCCRWSALNHAGRKYQYIWPGN